VQILLDTNILVRSFNKASREHGETVRAVAELRRMGHTPVIVPQCLYEYWVVATRPIEQNGYGLTTYEADKRVEQLQPPLFQLLLDERAILPRWRDLVTRYEAKGKSAHDTRIVAAMVRHGLTHLLSWNSRHFARYTEVVSVTPSEALNGAIQPS